MPPVRMRLRVRTSWEVRRRVASVDSRSVGGWVRGGLGKRVDFGLEKRGDVHSGRS